MHRWCDVNKTQPEKTCLHFLHFNPFLALKEEEIRAVTVLVLEWWFSRVSSTDCTPLDPAAPSHTPGTGRSFLGSDAAGPAWCSQTDPAGGGKKGLVNTKHNAGFSL